MQYCSLGISCLFVETVCESNHIGFSMDFKYNNIYHIIILLYFVCTGMCKTAINILCSINNYY